MNGNEFEIVIESKGKTLIDQGLISKNSTTGIEKVLRKNKDLLKDEDELLIMLWPQEDEGD